MICSSRISMKTAQDKFINVPDVYVQKIFQTASHWDILDTTHKWRKIPPEIQQGTERV